MATPDEIMREYDAKDESRSTDRRRSVTLNERLCQIVDRHQKRDMTFASTVEFLLTLGDAVKRERDSEKPGERRTD